MTATKTAFALFICLLLAGLTGCGSAKGGGGGGGGGGAGQFLVRGLGNTPIYPGTLIPSTAAGTDYGIIYPGGSQTHTFTLDNDSDDTVFITSAVTTTGVDAFAFVVTEALVATSLAPGETATFDLAFNPANVLSYSATVQFDYYSNEDGPALASTYSFAVQGAGGFSPTEPEIDVKGAPSLELTVDDYQDIVDGSAEETVSRLNGTLFGQLELNSNLAEQHQFVIRNYGGVALNVASITITGADAADFTFFGDPSSIIQSEGAAYFVLAFEPLNNGNGTTRTATVTINSDDDDEGAYTFVLVGSAITPEIQVTSITGAELPSAGTNPPTLAIGTHFGDVAPGSRRRLTFTVSNIGTAPLHLLDNPPVVVTGDDHADFEVLFQNPSDVVQTTDRELIPGESTLFWVDFAPSFAAAAGDYTATLVMQNNDLDEGIFLIYLEGTVLAQTITLWGPDLTTTAPGDLGQISYLDSSIAGSWTEELMVLTSNGTRFPNVFLAGFGINSVTHTFTITNLSATDTLSLQTNPVYISGPGAGHFQLTQPASLSLAPGASTTFNVTFMPDDYGLKEAVVNILNSDPNLDPFVFPIRAEGLASDIQVTGWDPEGKATEILDGDFDPSVEDGTYLGSLAHATEFGVATFGIRNNGNTILTLTGWPEVEISGQGAAGFYVPAWKDVGSANPVTGELVTTVDPIQLLEIPADPEADLVLFTLYYLPPAPGYTQVTLTIRSDDPNETAFSFDVMIFGSSPMPQILGNNLEIPNGDATPRTEDYTDLGLLDQGTDDPGDLWGDNEGVGATGSYERTFCYAIYSVGDDDVDLLGIEVSNNGIPAGDDAYCLGKFPAAGTPEYAYWVANFDTGAPDGLINSAGLITAANMSVIWIPTPDADFKNLRHGDLIDGLEILWLGDGWVGVEEDEQALDYTRDPLTQAITGHFWIVYPDPVPPHTGMTMVDFWIDEAFFRFDDLSGEMFTYSIVPPGDFTYFTLSCRPRASMTTLVPQVQTVTLLSNSTVVYTFNVQMTPNLVTCQVREGVVDIDDEGAGVSFGAHDVLASATRTFTIHNTSATQPLWLNDALQEWVRIAGTNDTDFSVDTTAMTTAYPPSDDGIGNTIIEIPPLGAADFDVIFTPLAPMARRASVVISTNDGEKTIYSFPVYGTGNNIASPASDD